MRRNPKSAAARGGLGRLHVLRGQFAAGEPHLQAALEMDPDLIDVRYYLAVALMGEKRCEEAVVEFRRLVGRQPDHGQAHLRLGQCLYTLREKGGAARALEEAVRYIPNDLTAQKNLGVVLFELNRFPEAVVQLERAAALAPADRQVESLLARARARAPGRQPSR